MPKFDIFEILLDGSCIWRACVAGADEKDRKLLELTRTSANTFRVLNLAAGDTWPIDGIKPTATKPIA